MKKSILSPAARGNLLLILTAFIWGVAFVAQKEGGSALGGLTFNGVRFWLGGGMLALLLPLLDRIGLTHRCDTRESKRAMWLGGVLCGIALWAASNVQQIGLLTTSAGKGGFITALYIVLVPIFGLCIGRRTTLLTWLGVVLAMIGLYFLCMQGESGLNSGDLLVLACAPIFAVQILLVDKFAPHTDGVRLSCIEFFTVGILNIPLMFIFEQPSLPAMLNSWMPLCYAGLLSSGVAYTLQVVAQKNTHPATASVLMSLESVFAVLAGLVLMQERLSAWELIGCTVMFAAVILAQLPPLRKKGA